MLNSTEAETGQTVLKKEDPSHRRCLEMLGQRYKRLSSCSPLKLLVGGLEHVLFFHILGIVIPTD